MSAPTHTAAELRAMLDAAKTHHQADNAARRAIEALEAAGMVITDLVCLYGKNRDMDATDHKAWHAAVASPAYAYRKTGVMS